MLTVEEAVLKPFKDNADIIADRVASGIEANRKGRAVIKVVDEHGAAVPNATVRIVQKNHDFKHGANIFMLDEFECAEKNALYRDMFKNYFNLATIPFYWNTLEPEEGKPRYAANSPKVYRRPAPDLCLDYCESNGVSTKAHCLNYDHFSPDWLDKYSTAQQWKLLEKRFEECSSRYAKRIPAWEVTNELFWATNKTKMYYDPMFMEKSFALAAHYFLNNELISNEGQEPFRSTFLYNRNPAFLQIDRALLRGARIDTIGLQYHLWSTPETVERIAAVQFNPINIYRVLDTFWNTFHKPMQITEVTFPCYDPVSKSMEDVQAEVLKNIYSIFFSHPALEAVIYWNLVDGYAYNAQPGDFTNGENKLAGGLAHFDLSPKPALLALRQLFKETWHTAATLVTDEGGYASFKGFYGDYDAEIIADGQLVNRSFHLEKLSEGRFRHEIKLG